MARLPQITASLALVAMAIGSPASARLPDNLAQSGMRDSRVQAGIIIPFGSAGSRAERAPRLELRGERSGSMPSGYRLRDDRDPAKIEIIRLGIAFDAKPTLIVNGRELPQQGSQQNIGALGWVGIGAGVLVVTLGLAVIGAFGECLTPC